MDKESLRQKIGETKPKIDENITELSGLEKILTSKLEFINKKIKEIKKADTELLNHKKEVEGRTLVVKEARPLEKEKERSQEESHFEEKIPVGRDKHSSEREHKERGRKKRKKPEEKIE